MKNKKKSKPTENAFSSHEFEGLASFEEIDGYTLYKKGDRREIKFLKYDCTNDKNSKSTKNAKQKNKRKHENKINKENSDKVKVTEIDRSLPSKRKRLNDKSSPASKKKLKKIDVNAWRSIFAPEEVISALNDVGFKEPSPIQKLCIPSAIGGHKDVVGAAETGSGKTLAFIIPIIHGILKDKNKQASNTENDEASETKEELEDIDNSGEEIEGEENIGCVKVVDNIKFDFPTGDGTREKKASRTRLRALVITPTRELAIQIKKHTDAVLTKTDIKCAVVIGGLSQEKQERILSRGPEIVIGTPGRLWEMIQHGNHHLSQLSEIGYLAIDETDRMLQKGHFEELVNLLELINEDSAFKKRRQNFVFSATLMFTHEAPFRANPKKKLKKVTKEEKLQQFIELVGIRHKPKIIDITRKFGTAEMLYETKIICDEDEKEVYLYYFISQFPGRTLVFCNSINCVKRLENLLNILKCKCQSLHALKQQRQRLTNLERFAANKDSVLLATDVAARGLDIPDVNHIIHYEIPKTAETYVHRSGRTARADKEGLSVLLIDFSEATKYRKLCTTLNRSSNLASFPVEAEAFRAGRVIVDLAKDIERAQYRMKKTKSDNDWLQKMVQEAGLETNENSDDDDNVAQKAMEKKRTMTEIQVKKKRLSFLLTRIPMKAAAYVSRYPSCIAAPTNYLNKTNEGALSVAKKGKKKVKIGYFTADIK